MNWTRLAWMVYNLYCNAVSGIALLWFVLFIENWGLPRTVSLPLPHLAHFHSPALLTDLGLVALFGLQHSLMARTWFKQWLGRLLPPQGERSTYVLLSGLALALIVWLWQPFGNTLWDVRDTLWELCLYALSLTGLLVAGVSALAIDGLALMGWRQATGDLRADNHAFVTPLFYRYVRHPIYLGVLLAVWATPLLTVSHLVFAAALTIYVGIGIFFEEKALVQRYGDLYQHYQKTVPMLLPHPRRRWDAGGG